MTDDEWVAADPDRRAAVEGWLAGPRVGPSPPQFRHLLVRQHAERYGLDALVESGTCYGDTVAAVRDRFAVVYSIELSPALHARCAARFAGDPGVHLLAGDSGTLLGPLLAELDRPVVLWLDGHYSHGDTALGDVPTPIRAELAAVFGSPHRHVALVDDARCFAEGSDHDREWDYASYPPISWVAAAAAENDYRFALADDVMRLTP